MNYRTQYEKARLAMASGIVTAAGIGLLAGLAVPVPETNLERLYELAVYAVPGETHIADYNLTFSDCVGLWADYPASVGLECNPVGER